jgi:hypothetical protein
MSRDQDERKAYIDGPFKDDVAAMILAEEKWRSAWDVNRAMCDAYYKDRAAAQRASMEQRRNALLEVAIDYRAATPPDTELDAMVKDDMAYAEPRDIVDICATRHAELKEKMDGMMAAYVDGVVPQRNLLKYAGLIGLFAKNLIRLQQEYAEPKKRKGMQPQ